MCFRCINVKNIFVPLVESRDSGPKIVILEFQLSKLSRYQANAVQHVDAGACPVCRGKELALEYNEPQGGVYNFISRSQVGGITQSQDKPSRALESDLKCITGDMAYPIWPTAA